MKLNKIAPSAHPMTVPAFALASCLSLSIATAAPWYGDLSVLPGSGEAGNAVVTGNVESGGDLSAHGVVDFGVATSNATLPGLTLKYLGSSEHDAAFDLTDSLGSFLWRDNSGGTVRPKMKLSTDNILSVYNAAGTSATITLQGATGQINLSGTGSGITQNGTSVFTVGSTGSITWDRPLGITSTTAAQSSITGALTVAGGIGVGLDSYFNNVRIGKGKNNRDYNMAVGEETMMLNTTGTNNTALGYGSMQANTTGSSNTGVGVATVYYNSTGSENTAVGRQALCTNTTGSSNTAVGKSAIHQGSGSYNAAVGAESQRYSLTGYGNSTLGYQTLYNITSGYQNVALGRAALLNNNTGANNIAIGAYSGRYQANGSSTLANPENSIYIGANARGYSDADDNSIVIGYGSIGEGANTTVIGNSATTSTHLYGQTNANSLKVTGQSELGAQVTVEQASTAAKAMKVLADGTILIKPGGNLSMGSFTAGAQP
ncbi:hypothetical protein [Luteolibacter soli]|uniref:Trimeric autotransporter adhesin YadA-like head domain-containing protein n=1 Tax=Luteolibacter soli TaxID=3135280 RepID=A0ABU9AV69_9BACT